MIQHYKVHTYEYESTQQLAIFGLFVGEMNDLKERLQVVRAGVERLTKERDEQRARVAKLAAQMHDETGMLDILRKRIAELEHENKVLKTSQTFAGADGRQSRERIDKLVKEIDNCLGLLKG